VIRKSGSAALGLHDALGGSGKFGERLRHAGRAFDERAAAIGAFALEHAICAGRTVGAFEGADAGLRSRRVEVLVAAFAVGAHLEHGGRLAFTG
jgi:hypothetical protein